jgi:hypothetical protein
MKNQTHRQNPFRGSVEHWVIEMVPRYVVFDVAHKTDVSPARLINLLMNCAPRFPW